MDLLRAGGIAQQSMMAFTRDEERIADALALVLSERKKPGDAPRAIELAKRAILREPMPLTWWVLARAETDGKSDYAMAEYYSMTGKKKESREYARRAQSKLPAGSPEYIKSGDILKLK